MANPTDYVSFDVRGVQSMVLCLVVFLALFIYFRRPTNIPPGPYGWPLVGNLPLTILSLLRKEHTHDFMSKLAKKYGNVFSLSFGGSTRLIILNDLKSIKDVFQKPEASDRFVTPVIEQATDGRGVLVSSGQVWKHQRRFALSVFRGFGIGKASFDSQIAEEARHLCDKMAESNGHALDPRPLLMNATSNMICSLLLGKRFDYDDKDFHYLLSILDKRIKCIGSGGVQVQVPLLRLILRKNTNDLLKSVKENVSYFTKVISDHKSVLEGCDDTKDLIDLYLKEIDRVNVDPEMKNVVNEDHLVSFADNLFLAGTETSSNTLAWCLLHLIHQPDLQGKIRSEIQGACGSDTLPTYLDREKMPFTEAVILEVQRLHTIVPLGVPHYTNKDFTTQGYTIPKGSVVISNLWAVHHDPDVWEDPNEFKPARFLDSDGNVTVKEEWIPFSTGRRICLGEKLARMEIFIFLTHILTRFALRKKDGSTSLSFDGRTGATYGPMPYEMRVESLI